VSELGTPLSDEPLRIDWGQGTDGEGMPVDISWWAPTTAAHGGRRNTRVVIASNGYMYTFNSRGSYTGTVSVRESWRSNLGGSEFWPLTRRTLTVGLWLDADRIRPSRTILAMANGMLGVTDRTDSDQRGRSWRVAHACLLLGFSPPLGLDFGDIATAFAEGVGECGDRAARRIKRALLSRLAIERRARRAEAEREVRQRAETIERCWR